MGIEVVELWSRQLSNRGCSSQSASFSSDCNRSVLISVPTAYLLLSLIIVGEPLAPFSTNCCLCHRRRVRKRADIVAGLNPSIF